MIQTKTLTTLLLALAVNLSLASTIPSSPKDVFLTDTNGNITYRYVNADYSVRLSGEELLKAAE